MNHSNPVLFTSLLDKFQERYCCFEPCFLEVMNNSIWVSACIFFICPPQKYQRLGSIHTIGYCVLPITQGKISTKHLPPSHPLPNMFPLPCSTLSLKYLYHLLSGPSETRSFKLPNKSTQFEKWDCLWSYKYSSITSLLPCLWLHILAYNCKHPP